MLHSSGLSIFCTAICLAIHGNSNICALRVISNRSIVATDTQRKINDKSNVFEIFLVVWRVFCACLVVHRKIPHQIWLNFRWISQNGTYTVALAIYQTFTEQNHLNLVNDVDCFFFCWKSRDGMNVYKQILIRVFFPYAFIYACRYEIHNIVSYSCIRLFMYSLYCFLFHFGMSKESI